MFQRPQLVGGGEWWYAMMQPEIFVEQAIDDHETLSEWKQQTKGKRFVFESEPGIPFKDINGLKIKASKS